MDSKINPALKRNLHRELLAWIDTKIASLDEAIHTAITSRDGESKSSAGDKHETGRAMVQIEIDNLQLQKQKTEHQKEIISNLDLDTPHIAIGHGSLVDTSMGIFFIAVGIGKIQSSAVNHFVISADAPMGIALKGYKQGDTVAFRGNKILIHAIC